MYLNGEITELIARRRRQLYVNSVLYYRHCTSIISDATFDRWAYELAELQRKHPAESEAAIFASEFSGWDGTTGFDLPWNRDIENRAAYLVKIAGKCAEDFH
ncbi:hypothetical protein ACFOQM_23480 [Paenibacillus sp. GCM10012307]|uniref:DNA ligase LigA-related protein n=1 Tax=Paenibacillus TaxID=44249 RepID=UPI00361A8719